MIFREGFQNEDFVAFYNGNKFYTGPLDSNFTEALEKLISLRALAFGDIVEYLERIGVNDVNIDDTFDVASTFSKALFYAAADGEDYWNFDGFEIFPEYELAESMRRKKSIKEGKTMPYVLWVLDGDTKQWEMYKGVNDAKQFIRDNDYDEFLDELNTQVFPNETYYNNYIDWIVIPAGEEPRKFDTHKFYNSLKYESIRRLGEGNASLKTNYAVIVYDMNTGSYNLYTGTKKMCEQLYKDLFDFNIDDYDDDEKDDMYDWLYDRLNEFNCIERIDFRRGIDYRDNYSDGYDKYHIINYTKPRHPISLYL